MSNAIRYDPILVHYLARELDELLKGRAIATAPHFEADRSVHLALGGGEVLRIDLHPTRGWFRILPEGAPGGADPDGFCRRVEAPADERLLRFLIEGGGDRFRDDPVELVLELHTNQWNALLVGSDGRIRSVLRAREAGGRSLFAGDPYVPPPGRPRFGADEVERTNAEQQWMDSIEAAEPEERRRRLLAGFAWTGTGNAGWILGDQSDPAAAFERWWWLRALPPARPAVLEVEPAPYPYPLALSGIPSRPAPSLLAAMEIVAADSGREEKGEADAEIAAAAALARRRIAAAARRIERLEAEQTETGEAERLQAIGDLLLGRLHTVPRGETAVTLEGWAGEAVEVQLDPQLSPAENAASYYDRAGRRRRAEEQLPLLLAEAEADAERWRAALEEIEAGVVPPRIREALNRQRDRGSAAESPEAGLPYRLYRTSGGIEVRVGRSAKDNDRLTFQESSPSDVWLHARSVPGSHVILRWRDPDGAPPARDLAEAALLAAVFSRARTSGTVAVDWTRRKYVRKPRGAPPGAVIPQRVKTAFVEPDEESAERLLVRG